LLWTGGRHELMFTRLLKQKNWANFILNLPISDKMFGKFQYSSAVSHLLSVIITKTSNTSTQDFALKYLFKPIGILSSSIKWKRDPQGINIGGFGLCLKPRDLAKFGFLYSNGGMWNKKQVISKEWILESLKERVKEASFSKNKKNAQGYGYHLWLTKIKDFNTFMALGSGGQILTCISKLDLIIVFTSNSKLSRWKDPRYIMEKYINHLY